MRKAAARFFWALANHPTDPGRHLSVEHSRLTRVVTMETEISQFLLLAIFYVVATAIADWENGEEIAMMTIDVQPESFWSESCICKHRGPEENDQLVEDPDENQFAKGQSCRDLRVSSSTAELRDSAHGADR
jgi:hypothetical protein